MNDEAAFVAAIAAAPDDHHLPLVFADWLDDRGDPRGPWLRNHYVRPWMPPTYQSPIPKLLESLAKDKRVMEVRRAAAVIGEPIVPGLIELLKHQTPRVRQQACICLRNVGKPAKDAVPALLGALSDSDYSVREQAAKALKDIGTAEVTGTDQLKAALTDGNWSVRRTASKVLGAMRAKGDVVGELAERLDSPDADDRKEAIEGLAQLGTVDVVPHLGRAAADADVEVRIAAVQALGRLKYAAAAGPLCAAMAGRSPDVRRAAVEQFAGYSRTVPHTPAAVGALQTALADKFPAVRALACTALARAGTAATGAVPALRKCLTDAVREVRAEAADALGVVARNDPVVRDALVLLVGDAEPVVSGRALVALGKWDELPAAVARPLLDYLATALASRAAGSWDYNPDAAFAALGGVKNPPPAALDRLREAIRDWNAPHCWAAVNALRALGPAAAPALPELLALVRAENFHGEVVKALVAVGPPALDRLAEIIDGPDDGPRWNVVNRMYDVGEAALPLLPALLRLLRRTPEDWRRGRVVQAIRALGPGATDAAPDLLDALEEFGRYQGGSDAFQALVAFGPALVPHLPRLVDLSRRPVFAEWGDAFADLFARLAGHTPDALAPLRDLLARSHAAEGDEWSPRYAKRRVRQAALRGLLKLDRLGADLIPDLTPLAADPEADVRRELVPLLAALGVPAIPLLLRTLGDADEVVRVRSADALAGDSSDETLAALVGALEDRAPKVRRAAVDALGKLKVGTDAVVAALAAATEDADKKVAERAAVALKKVTPKAPKAKKAPAPTKGKKKRE